MVLVTIFGSPREEEDLPILSPIFLVLNPEIYVPYENNTSGSVGLRSEMGKSPVPLPETTYTGSKSLVTSRKTFSVSAGGLWVDSLAEAPEWVFPAFKAAYTEPTQIKGSETVTYDSAVTKNLKADWLFKNDTKVLITSQEQGVVKLITQGTFRTVIGGSTEPEMPETHDKRHLDEGPVDSPAYKPKASINDVEIDDVLRSIQARGNIFDPSRKSGYQDGFGNPGAHGKNYTESGDTVDAAQFARLGGGGFGLGGGDDPPDHSDPDRYHTPPPSGDPSGTSSEPYPDYPPPPDPPEWGYEDTIPPTTGTPDIPTWVFSGTIPPVTGNPDIPTWGTNPRIPPTTGLPDIPYGWRHPPEPEKYIATIGLSDVLAYKGEAGGIIRKNNDGNFGENEHVYVHDRAVVNEGAEGDKHGRSHDAGTWFTGFVQDYVFIEDVKVNNGGDPCDGRGGCTHQIIHTDDLVEIHFS